MKEQIRNMKVIITLLIIALNTSVQSQDIFTNKVMKENREQVLMSFIKSDMDLYSHYKSGERNLKTGKVLGYTSLGFLTGGGISIYAATQASGYDFILPFIIGGLSFITSAVVGTIGTLLHYKGKEKIKDVMDYANRERNNGLGKSLQIETSNNGMGLVYNF